MNLYTHTSTYTATRIEVVAKQFKRGLLCSGISQIRAEKVLAAFREKKLSAIGIYALDNNNTRVAEVEISVDWAKHENIIKIFGIQYEYSAAINRNTGEAAETKVYVDSLLDLAKNNDYALSCWIRVSDEIVKNRKEYRKLLRKLGFGGAVEEWKSSPQEMSNETILALEEMKVRLYGINGNSQKNIEEINQRILHKVRMVTISLVVNYSAFIFLTIVYLLSRFFSFSFIWVNTIPSFIPLISFLIYFYIGQTWKNDIYGRWTIIDTALHVVLIMQGVVLFLHIGVFNGNQFFERLSIIVMHLYPLFVLGMTTYRDICFIKENGRLQMNIKIHIILSAILYSTLFATIVIGLIIDMKPNNIIHTGDTVVLGSFDQDNDPYNGREAIYWTVQDVQDGKALVVCDASIWAIQYNAEGLDNSWANSDIRYWLNQEFYDSAFTVEEKGIIQVEEITTITYGDSEDGFLIELPGYETVTRDKVFVPETQDSWDIANAINVSETARAYLIDCDLNYQLSYTTLFWARNGYYQSEGTYCKKNFVCGYYNEEHPNCVIPCSPSDYALVRPALYIDVDAYSE